MKFVADHIRAHQRADQRKEYALFFVPRRTMIAERHLEEEGVYDDVTIGEYHLDLIPFDHDLLSLELEDSFKECYLEGDRTSLFYVARALMKLQSIFGIIPHIKAKGACSKSVVDMLLRMRREMGGDEPSMVTPEIDTLILIDRQVDMVTPMCTQLTYEGLLDEVFLIQNSYVDLEPEFLGLPEEAMKKAKEEGKKIKTPMNSNDKLYSQLRDLNFAVLGPLLNKKAKEIDEYYKKRYEFQTVSQIRDFMRGLGTYQQEHQSLRLHTNIAEHILSITKRSGFRQRLEAEQNILVGNDEGAAYIEECINKRDSLLKVLRLISLLSLCNGGLPAKQFDFFRSEILSTYGYEYLFTMSNMERLGLLRKQEGKAAFPLLRKALRLIVEDVNEAEPNDIAYVYSGYAPLSVRLVELKDQWRQLDEVMRLLPGPTVEKDQELPQAVLESSTGGAATRNKVTLVVFIGGITFTEISAIRYLGQLDENRDYIIATTKLINGDTFLSTLLSSFAAES